MESMCLLSFVNISKANSLAPLFPNEGKESTKNGDMGHSTRFKLWVIIYAIPKIQVTIEGINPVIAHKLYLSMEIKGVTSLSPGRDSSVLAFTNPHGNYSCYIQKELTLTHKFCPLTLLLRILPISGLEAEGFSPSLLNAKRDLLYQAWGAVDWKTLHDHHCTHG